VAQAIRQVRETGSEATVEFFTSGRGRERWNEARFLPLPDERVVIIIRDVSERKRVEAQLRVREERYRVLFDVSPVPAWVFDTATLEILAANDAAAGFYGHAKTELLTRNVEDLLPAEEVADFLAGLAGIRPTAGERVRSRHRTKDRRIVEVEVTSHALLFDGRAAQLVLASDVTERRRAEALCVAKEIAERESRAKSAFLANMSHELRTPLNAIIGYAEMLEEDAVDRGQTQLTLDLRKIRAAGHHLLAVINDILDLSKIEAGKVEVQVEAVEIPRMVEEIAQTIQPLVAENGNSLEVHCARRIGTLRADSTKLRQALFNLLSNACKFTELGRITFEVERENKEGQPWICFHVRDTGIGMTEEQQQRLFKDFARVDTPTGRRYAGSGLGLAISRRFCRMMGGDIEVSSEPGEGSTFTIRLPAHARRPAARRGQSPPVSVGVPEREAKVRSQELRPVLIIDDDAAECELLSGHLNRRGFSTVVATDGQQGLRLARESDPLAITLDVIMPGISGWSVLQALKADPHLAGIPVILVTVTDDDEARGRALGCAEHLTKPVDRERLVACLRAMEIETRVPDSGS
jgi:PAS domain S-box-containing protein